MTIVPKDFSRGQYNKPLIIPAGGGKPVAYRRMTSYIDVLADKFKLNQWDKRQVAVGLAQREDLRLSVLAHLGDRDALDRACRDAKEYALASAAATNGTSFHTLTDIIDAGGELPAGLPDNIVRTLDAFRTATADLKVVAIEPKTVLDAYQVAGTPDRVYEYQGTRYIGDTKTGVIRFGTQKIAAQLAGYSRSRVYDVDTGERTPHYADVSRGIIMDVDLQACTVDLIWVDLIAGWRAVQVAAQVWEQRSLDKFDRLTRPWGDTDGFNVKEPKPSRRVGVQPRPVEDRIKACTTAEDVRALWTPDWTEDLNEVARQHIAGLGDHQPPTAA